ncbi:hypothetical protein [Novosphingobium hassiacum]|uniref:hypothetical protein n=1 Tax=Novosphingobium hassiacum TaxID=173676 RepID=UPI001614AB84|nr:hypothetical protein [Novosphingobium hassiacum]
MPDTADATTTDWNAALTAALDWWRDAGVDGTFVDDAQNWLASGKTEGQRSAPPPPLNAIISEREVPALPKVGDPSQWPKTLDAFRTWWMSEPLLAPAGLNRFAPEGQEQASLMVLVPMPSPDDNTSLLSGRGGRLLDAMLAAMGIERSRTYIASAVPAYIPMPDWEGLRATGLGDVLLHHITLAAPAKLLILGGSRISTLLGHAPTNLAHGLRGINQETSGIDAMPAWDLDAMLVRPALKAGFWSRWLEWTGN